MTGNYRVLLISVSVLLISSIAVCAMTCPDDSEADNLPVIGVYHTDTGARLKGAILDYAQMDASTSSTPEGTVFILEEGSTLISGTSYIMASGDGDYSFRLIGALIDNSKTVNKYLSQTGLKILFYTNPECTGTPSFYADMEKGQSYVITADMELNVPYYIEVQILHRGVFTDKPNIKDIGFTFTIDSGPSVNAVYFNDGQGVIIDQKLMTNGTYYTFPEQPVRPGYQFTGWYTNKDVRINTDTVVNLSSDTTLYAHWWKGGTGDVEIITPSDDYVKISTEIDPGKGVVMDIIAVDPDGNILLDESDIDAGKKVIELDFNGGEGSGCIFDYPRSNDIVEVFDAVDEWLSDHEIDAIATVNVTPGNTVTMEPAALGLLQSRNITLTIVGDLAVLRVNPAMQKDLSGYDEDLVLTVKEAGQDPLTPMQKAVIGSNAAYSVTLKSGDRNITSFEGLLTIEIPYTEPLLKYSLSVYCVGEDGSCENMHAKYSKGLATFTTDHLSVYVVEIQKDLGFIPKLGVLAIFAMTTISIISVMYRRFIDGLEDDA